MADYSRKSTVEITGEIVAAYLGNNTISAGSLPDLIKSVHSSISSVSGSSVRDSEEGAQFAAATGKAEPRRSENTGTQGTTSAGSSPAPQWKGRSVSDPAVPIAESVKPDYLICLEDGKQLKMLKRYLHTNYGMTPADYRRKWGLAPDYPMVAENYSKRRSEAAKRFGLGRKGFRRKIADRS